MRNEWKKAGIGGDRGDGAGKSCLRWLKRYGVTTLVMVSVSCVLRYSVAAARQTRLQQGIAEEVLRFHVLANSDSNEDQKIKLRVRDRVLEWVEEALGTDGKNLDIIRRGDGEISPDSGADLTEGEVRGYLDREPTGEKGIAEATKESITNFLAAHLSELEGEADAVLEECGVSYRASAAIERCYFPDRTYGDCVFPAGWYEALRIRLGEARGHNWWCVLYPRLCFADSLHAVMEEDQMRKLEEVLTVEEYENLLRRPKGWKISFRWF